VIKINIDEKHKTLIRTEHFKDTKTRVKPMIERLIRLPKYIKFKGYICDATGNIDEKKLKKLLVGTKSELENIISEVGVIKLDKNDQFEALYTNFTKRKWSKSLLDIINVRVCPYCNRQYTFTLKDDGIRPQFDHFFPKSLYSYLSISLYNLVPSCSICNSKKQNLDTFKTDFYYPFENEFGTEVVFQTKAINNDFLYWTGNSSNFDIKLVCKNNKQKCKVNNLNKYLKVELLYKQHKDVVRDIIRNAIIYNDSRINELMEEFPDLFHSKNDVIDSIFMNNCDEESWGNRPLSKLTHDIYEEFKLSTKN
jgi:hypothetical protein